MRNRMKIASFSCIFIQLLLSYFNVVDSANITLLSRGKPAFQSHTWANGYAAYAVDGLDTSIDTGWHSDVWWYVDLLEEFPIKYVTIKNRWGTYSYRLANVDIKCGIVLQNMEKCAHLRGPGISGRQYKLDCECVGRYIRLQRYGKSILPIIEIEVFGVRIVDGQWSNWTSCISKCVPGDIACNKTRTCTNPSPQNGGKECIGDNSIEEKCPVHGQWSDWTSCKSICASGALLECTKTRTCTNPKPEHGGKQCEGENSQKEICPIHGQWSDWTSCKSICASGALECTKTRTCTNPKPEHDGKECEGENSQNEICPIHWTDWSTCPASCLYDGLHLLRTRTKKMSTLPEGREEMDLDRVLEECKISALC